MQIMTEAELQLLKEALTLADDGLARLDDVKNESVKHIAAVLHAAIVLGNLIVSSHQ